MLKLLLSDGNKFARQIGCRQQGDRGNNLARQIGCQQQGSRGNKFARQIGCRQQGSRATILTATSTTVVAFLGRKLPEWKQMQAKLQKISRTFS
jgi:hypothetical protein